MVHAMRTGSLWLTGTGCAVLLGALVSCSATSPTPAPSTTRASASAAPSTSIETPFTPGPSDVNLPAPPMPSTPAASAAGGLTEKTLPAPPGWKPVVAAGGPDEGYIGNGTAARARDPRYAAYEILAIGCAPVTRADWTDPTGALEVELGNGSQQGFGEALQFATAANATTWFTVWKQQLTACTDVPNVTIVTQGPNRLIGRRDYGSGESYAELALVEGRLIRLYILADPQQQLNSTTVQQFADTLAGE